MSAIQSLYPGDHVVLWGVNVFVQLTLIAAVALLAARVFPRNAAMRHAILCSGLLLMLLSPIAVVVTQSAGPSWLPLSLAAAGSGDGSAERIVSNAVGSAADRSPERRNRIAPGPHLLAGMPPLDVHPDGAALNPTAIPLQKTKLDSSAKNQAAVAGLRAAADDEPAAARSTAGYGSPPVRFAAAAVLWIWAAGVVLLLARLLLGWIGLVSLMRRARPVSGEQIRAAAARARQVLATPHEPGIISSPSVASPIAAGLWRPRVVLPTGISDRLAPRELREILIHEIAHVARRDPAIVLLQNLAAALFWIHPAVRLLNRQLARAREEICDNCVLAVGDAPSYSRTLLHLARSMPAAVPLPWTAGLWTSRWTLESRVAGLLDERRNLATRLPARATAGTVVLSAAVAVIAWCGTIRPAPAEDAGPGSARSDSSPVANQSANAAVETAPDPETPIRKTTDALGDPLPEAALLRLGTTRFRHPSGAFDLALSPDGQSAATIGSNELIVWNTATGEQRWQSNDLGRHFGLLAAAYGTRLMAFTADSRWLYTVGDRDELIVWETASGQRETVPMVFAEDAPRQDRNPYRSVDVAPDGASIALGGAAGVIVCGRDGRVRYRIANNPAAELEQMGAQRPGFGGQGDRLTMDGHYSTACFSADGKVLAAVTSDSPQVLRLCDPESGNELRRIELSAWLVRMAFSPDGKRIAATERDNSVRLYDVDSGQRVWSHTVELSNPYETYTSAIAFSPDGALVAAGATDRCIYLLDAAGGDEVGRLTGHGWYPWGLAFTADSRMLFSSGWDGSIRRWDVNVRTQLPLPAGIHATGIVAASPDGRLIAYVTDAGAVEIVRAADGTPHRTIAPSSARYSRLAFSPDGRRLAGGGSNNDQVHVALWDVENGALFRRWEWPQGRDPHSTVECFDFTPDGGHLAAAVFRQSKAYVWDIADDRQVAELPHSSIYGLSFSPDGMTLATAGWDSAVRFWDTATGEMKREHKVAADGDPDADNRMYTVCYSPLGGLLATAHLDGKVRVWGADDLKLQTQFALDGRFIFGALEFSPDGLWLATGSQTGKLKLWDSQSGQAVWDTGAHEGYVYAVDFGRDSRTLASGGRDGVCYVWDLRTPRDLPDRDAAVLWDDLGGRSAEAAWDAMWSLSETPERAVAFLAEVLRPVKPRAEPEMIQQWITDLDAAEFETRKAAQVRLASLGAAAAEPLRQALANATSPEQVARLRKLLADLESGGQALAARRTVAVLGWLNTPAADRLLQELAREDPDGVIGRSAAAARRR
jgi:WD40 repeat protein/beta-lactamase regulating signal transducer with metallopeptidase domain